MGQRTQLLVNISTSGTTTINGEEVYSAHLSTFAHHFQCGIGRVMPKAALSMLMAINDGYDLKPIHAKAVDTITALNGESNLMTLDESLDITDAKAVREYIEEHYDNNNGAMVVNIDITREGYETISRVHIGFIYGYEEYEYGDCPKDTWVDMDTYMKDTWGNKRANELIENFGKAFRTIVEQYFDEVTYLDKVIEAEKAE